MSPFVQFPRSRFNFRRVWQDWPTKAKGKGQNLMAFVWSSAWPQGLFPTSSTTCASTTRLFMEFATETQTGPSRWTTDDVDIIPPTMPELQHPQRKWPLPITLFAVAITLVFIGMKWREARRRRKLKEWRIARSVSAARLPKAFATSFALPGASSRLSR